jgi:hypothetical protein
MTTMTTTDTIIAIMTIVQLRGIIDGIKEGKTFTLVCWGWDGHVARRTFRKRGATTTFSQTDAYMGCLWQDGPDRGWESVRLDEVSAIIY